MTLGKATATILGITLGLLSGASQAQPILFTRIADTHTPVPGGINGQPADFEYFRGVAIDGSLLVFEGEDSGGYSGLFTSFGGAAPQAVVTSDMQIPGSSERFWLRGSFSVDGGEIAFVTGTLTTSLFRAQGGSLLKIADTQTPIPGGSGTFTALVDTVSLDAGTALFMDWNSPGLYLGNANSVERLTDAQLPPPGYPAPFVNFFEPVFDSGNAAFVGIKPDLSGGIYLANATQTFEVARLNDPAPGAPWQFRVFGDLSIDGSDVAFTAADFQDHGGVYLWSAGTLIRIADSNTPVPGGSGQFQRFFTTSVSGGNVLFWARTGGDTTGIFLWSHGELRKVLATGDMLDGNPVYDPRITRESLSGSRIATVVSFSGGADTWAVYLADLAPAFAVDVPVLGPATLALLALGLATAAVILLRLRS
jgi:hypothetical protein